MADLRLPYVIWRDGRPRFQSSGREQALGFPSEDLRQRNGAWFTFEEAEAWAFTRYSEILSCRGFDQAQVTALITAFRLGNQLRIKPVNRIHKVKTPAARSGNTVEDLLRDWLAAISDPATSGEKVLAPETIEGYRKFADAVIYKPETRAAAKERRAIERAAELLGQAPPEREKELFSTKPVSAIGVPELKNFYRTLKTTRGHHMALACIAVISAAWTWGKSSTTWRLGPNPRHELELDRPKGRIVVYTAEEITARLAAGDAIGRHSVGDATLLGLFTGQRQKDRLALSDEGLFDARRRFRQSKTNVVVEIKEAPRLAQRLAQAKLRAGEISLRTRLKPETIVVDERTGWSFDKTSYRHAFADVTRATVHGVVRIEGKVMVADPAVLGADFATRLHNQLEWITQPFAAVKGKTDQDLRDTCVTFLYRCGNDLQAICDVTGHSYKAVDTIVKHYLARNRQRADQAIDRMVAWMAAEGMAV